LGKDNKLLWNIPEDLKRFRELTQGHAVIMGRKTFESIGKPLQDRLNIVTTRDIESFMKKVRNQSLSVSTSFDKFLEKKLIETKKFIEINRNFIICPSLEDAINTVKKILKSKFLNLNSDEVYIIGGGQIYEQALPYADKLYLTIIDRAYPEADTYFPDYSMFPTTVSEEKHKKGDIISNIYDKIDEKNLTKVGLQAFPTRR